MLTAEEGVDLLVYDRTPTEENRWAEREQGHPWVSAASRWLRSKIDPKADPSGADADVGAQDVAAHDVVARDVAAHNVAPSSLSADVLS